MLSESILGLRLVQEQNGLLVLSSTELIESDRANNFKTNN